AVLSGNLPTHLQILPTSGHSTLSGNERSSNGLPKHATTSESLAVRSNDAAWPRASSPAWGPSLTEQPAVSGRPTACCARPLQLPAMRRLPHRRFQPPGASPHLQRDLLELVDRSSRPSPVGAYRSCRLGGPQSMAH